MKDLDILNLPLYEDKLLIEASAGTGKTYNLIIIYLRLLLGLHNHSFYVNPLTVQEILVVTFTKSAVQNLKIRIRNSIHQLKLDCIQGYSDNLLFSQLLLQINNKKLAIDLLFQSEKEIGEASIYTIHSFCQKILTENTIELKMMFHSSIIDNELSLYQKICSDFWRQYFYKLPLNITNLIQGYWKNPEELLQDIFPYIHSKIPKIQYSQFIHKSNKNISIYYDQIINIINNIKQQWIIYHIHIPNIINQYNPNRKIYNKKNLKPWINTISQWATQNTTDHILPNNLKRFKLSALQTNKNLKNNSTFTLFNLIEELYQRLSSFKGLIFDIAIHNIRHHLNINKHIRSKITFNDLIDLLLHSGIKNKNNKLAQKISTDYPIAIIDEFQDTDSSQYKIFHALYANHLKNNLILIGDPKQAIYGFRGADIFTYIKIRRSLYNKYNLNINWRSSPGMVNAVNQLFNISKPFIFQDIPFIPSLPAHQNNMYRFIINNKPQPSICFWLPPINDAISIQDYKKIMAKECAVTLINLLHHIRNQTAWLENNKHKKKILQISDIVILVRNYSEAFLMQSALSKLNISAEFLSNRQNIFETIESYELLLLLKAILFLDRKSICTALSTIFFGLNASKIEEINNNESEWNRVYNEFSEYYFIWKNYNILSMIQKIIFCYKIPEKLLTKTTGKNKLVNILHLGELLNKVFKELQNEYELIQWLESKIMNSHNHQETPDNYLLQFNYHQESIKISTIHKSKGLEFPITFLPFIASFNHNKKNFFHNRTSLKPYISFDDSQINAELSDEERLSEDLRLLYVAITRSIYHCSIGIAPIILKYRYKKILSHTDLHRSSIGYLIQNKKPGPPTLLKQNLEKLQIISKGDIQFRGLSSINTKQLHNTIPCTKNQNLSANTWIPEKYFQKKSWYLTSYSHLKNINNPKLFNTNFQELININLNKNDQQNNNSTTKLLNPHTFPQGKICGIFFHNLLQSLDFTKLIHKQWLQNQMMRCNIDLYWEKTILKWIDVIINTPINQDNLTLSKITSNNKQTELEFYLTIDTDLNSQKLEHLCKFYDHLSLKSPSLNFIEITGMLHGFIDLVFYWNHKYYLLDYKTNWLGENNDFYSQSKMEKNIIKNRYELQYQLYTLALHRFLKHRIKFYNYETNFGGIYYLFIRGMDRTFSNNGVFFCRPSWNFIKALDNLFQKKN